MSLILKHKEEESYFLIISDDTFDSKILDQLKWVFNAEVHSFSPWHVLPPQRLIGPKRNMVTPYSTNVCEILNNLGYKNVYRVEKFEEKDKAYDPLIQESYILTEINSVFGGDIRNKILFVFEDDIESFNEDMGLALSSEEIEFLEEYSKKIGRSLTDVEIFGFSQVNSEHCRHKIFNAKFIINKEIQNRSLFDMIRDTTEMSHTQILSAYSDNVAFIQCPGLIHQFRINNINNRFYELNTIRGAISLKAETHNFPTTVCAFPGAATGSGGEIRDRMGGGRGSIPGVGIAAYLTPYARISGFKWENNIKERKWLYQNPARILIEASNGASDYGNKFGQPLIAGTVTTFEHEVDDKIISYDKVIMLAGGVGHTNLKYIDKKIPGEGDIIILLGGDNYRIGVGGGSVSSLNTGECSNVVELNAVQRANPEMQNRVNRVIRTLVEDENNPIISIHDHGAGGHFNCLSELVENSGANFDMSKLPLGDHSLTDREILGNESQERMAIIVHKKDVAKVVQIAKREQCPVYVIGVCNDEGVLRFIHNTAEGDKRYPVNLSLEFLFKEPPKKEIICDCNIMFFARVGFPEDSFKNMIFNVLRLTKVASKEWLTHKVDRSVTGLVAQQQTVGPYQLPLADVAVKALDYIGNKGIAIGVGDRPIPGIVHVAAGVELSVGEALTNIVFAPLEDGIDSVVLSANWMWPCKQPNEDVRLYHAVKTLSKVCIDLGIPVPTGKDSLSMTQKYPDGSQVKAPGTVIITAVGACSDINKVITPDIKKYSDSKILYIPFEDIYNKDRGLASLGTSALAQTYNKLGGLVGDVPKLDDPIQFRLLFNILQDLIKEEKILAGHDISDGGIITALIEMAIAGGCGLDIDWEKDSRGLFYEGLGILIQVRDEDIEYVMASFEDHSVVLEIAEPHFDWNYISVFDGSGDLNINVNSLRNIWSKTSIAMDKLQMSEIVIEERWNNVNISMKDFKFPKGFNPMDKDIVNAPRLESERDSIIAAIVRDKGINGDREMAYCLYHAGFDVLDITMQEIIEGKANLDHVNFVVFPGGFSNSDVLGSARGWAGLFKYNERANKVLRDFYAREDTLSLGVCNGCQLMILLNAFGSLELFTEPFFELLPNESGIFESRFVSVDVDKWTGSVLFNGLEGSTLGVWVAHAEGRFHFKRSDTCKLELTYSSPQYPFNPNGSEGDLAGICSSDGRHVAMMPHLERSIFPWQWGYYPHASKKSHLITPWIIPFRNAYNWCVNKNRGIK